MKSYHVKKFVYVNVVLSQLVSASFAIKPEAQQSAVNISSQSFKIAEDIFKILQPYQILYDIDAVSVDAGEKGATASAINIANFIQELAIQIADKAPLQIVMIGFPSKSINDHKKVFGKLPDMAERSALIHLLGMLDKIRKNYPKGVTLTIISDGVAFNDILGVSDPDLKAYEAALKRLCADLEGIHFLTSDDMQGKGRETLQALREAILNSEPTEDAFQELLKSDSKTKNGYALMQKRLALEFDHPKGQSFLQIYPKESVAKRIIERAMKFGNFLKVNHIYPEKAIHFSVHYQPSTSKKFGIMLSPTSFITPWHGVFVEEKDQSYRIVHRQDVDLKLYRETGKTINGIFCPYFKPNNQN